MIADFGPNVADIDSWVRFEVLVPDWNYKGINSIFLALYNQLGKHQSMGGIEAQLSRPEFSGLDRGSINNELIGFQVQSGRRH